jgi:hypothetical protein
LLFFWSGCLLRSKKENKDNKNQSKKGVMMRRDYCKEPPNHKAAISKKRTNEEKIRPLRQSERNDERASLRKTLLPEGDIEKNDFGRGPDLRF